ncbi:terminase large subunit domain-containing protein [Sphingomonas sp. CFBP 8764]|uniref:terminase large subunit domain-containing protein n=1 Tax=Sphingomonas sp. CFBP 8764 TaxID=2775275 RepID=UPI001FD30225|nr:terminase large subunit [Sphingomonas sp. CFBP 8764]
MAVFTSLKIVDLPGQPTFGEASDEWLLDFDAAVFGAFDSDTNRQLITEYMLLISKKNTKSTLAAGIMLTELACGFRSYDENLILAPTKEVAANSFAPAMGMIDADEELTDLLKHQEHLKLITHREMKSTLKIVAADSGTVAGKKASRVLVDELWLFGEMANADSMLKEATGGQVSRPEGYTIYLTTQSDKPPAGVFKQKLNYFRDVRDGKIVDPRKLPVLYPEEMVADGDHLKRENFFITNPNMGRSVTQDWLEEKAAEADHGEDGPRAVFYAKELHIDRTDGKKPQKSATFSPLRRASLCIPEVQRGSSRTAEIRHCTTRLGGAVTHGVTHERHTERDRGRPADWPRRDRQGVRLDPVANQAPGCERRTTHIHTRGRAHRLCPSLDARKALRCAGSGGAGWRPMSVREAIPHRHRLDVVLIERRGAGWATGIGPIRLGYIVRRLESHKTEADAERAAINLADRLDMLAVRA